MFMVTESAHGKAECFQTEQLKWGGKGKKKKKRKAVGPNNLPSHAEILAS